MLDMDFDVTCSRVHKFASVYYIPMFCSCSTLDCLNKKQILNKNFSYHHLKFIDLLYYKLNIMLKTLFKSHNVC